MTISITVNGSVRTSARHPLTPLVDVLREDLALTGAKTVCREGFCGSCTIVLDGKAVASCLLPVGEAAGCDVRTIEGVAVGGLLSPLQRALEQHDAVQCGMCFPGMVMTLTSFLETADRPSREEVKAALSGNICRCTGYERIVDAVIALTTEGKQEIAP